MIPSAFAAAAWLWTAAPATPDQTLEHYRTPFEILTERSIGEASRAVRFDWRKSKGGIGLIGSQFLELNNFNSGRIGLFTRTAFGHFMGELSVNGAFTGGTDSSRQLSLTPYRQYGRPSRLEIGANLAYPLVEGVGTARLGFIPATEWVFSVNGSLRYLFYPGSFKGMSFGEVAKGLLAPKLGDQELENIERLRTPGMRVDPARYALLTGFSLDVYFQNGAFLSPRVMAGLPLFSAINGGGLGLWWELSLGLGWAL
ncbi:MAG: hypothetical protein ACT4TC_11600 [Myxococcaceae bacterium]